MNSAIQAVTPILSLYGETDVEFFANDEENGFCPECGEELDEFGLCLNGCLDDDDTDDFDEEDEVDLPLDLEDVRSGVDYLDTEEEDYYCR
jgi:hypothetical protein